MINSFIAARLRQHHMNGNTQCIFCFLNFFFNVLDAGIWLPMLDRSDQECVRYSSYLTGCITVGLVVLPLDWLYYYWIGCTIVGLVVLLLDRLRYYRIGCTIIGLLVLLLHRLHQYWICCTIIG